MKYYEAMVKKFPKEADKDNWEKKVKEVNERIKLFKEQEERLNKAKAKEREELATALMNSRLELFGDFLISNCKTLKTKVEDAIRRGTFDL